jgi:cold shock CspA family protein
MKGSHKKHFGTVKSFDETLGRGAITPETGGDDLRFERTAFSWQSSGSPTAGQRLSYDLAHTNGQPSAVNLAKI